MSRRSSKSLDDIYSYTASRTRTKIENLTFWRRGYTMAITHGSVGVFDSAEKEWDTYVEPCHKQDYRRGAEEGRATFGVLRENLPYSSEPIGTDEANSEHLCGHCISLIGISSRNRE